MLVATAVTLLLVAALTQAFHIIGTSVTSNRAALEMAGQMRGVAIRLKSDLAGVTVPLKPWPDPESGLGYFEYVEGWDHDGTPYLVDNTSFGDNDDVLMFTSHSEGEPFLGLYTDYYNSTPTPPTLNASPPTDTIRSKQAEIVWWTTLTDQVTTDTNGDGIADTGNGNPDPDQGEDFTLYRRVLLIRPDLNEFEADAAYGVDQRYLVKLPPPGPINRNPTYNITNPAQMQNLYDSLRSFNAENDISVHIERRFRPAGSSNLQVLLVANSLADLTKRENRFAHSRIVADNLAGPGKAYYAPAFPHHLDRDGSSATSIPLARTPLPTAPFAEPGLIKAGLFQGEDVMMAHTAGFDARAYDPLAPVSIYPGEDGAWGAAGVNEDGNALTDDVAEAGWPGTDDESVIPGDPGFALPPGVPSGPGAVGLVAVVRTAGGSMPLRMNYGIGHGAFVDLYYTAKLHHDTSNDYSYNAIDGLTAGATLPSPPHSSSPLVNSATDLAASVASNYYSHFSLAPTLPASGKPNVGMWPTRSNTPIPLATFGTWSTHYETDGLDQDGDAESGSPVDSLTGLFKADGIDNDGNGVIDDGIDEGADGLDSDGANGVDDPGERETSPPYLAPLRGLQVRFRMIEHDTRQVRQVTVETDFTLQ
jgi:hypothetical protein